MTEPCPDCVAGRPHDRGATMAERVKHQCDIYEDHHTWSSSSGKRYLCSVHFRVVGVRPYGDCGTRREYLEAQRD